MAGINVQKIAGLASIPLTVSEEKQFAPQLENILEYVDQLQQVDIKGVMETSQVTGKVNATRDDEETPCEKLVDGHIKVKAIFGND